MATHPTLPPDSRMRWRRIDVPGREESRIERMNDGWRLSGELSVDEPDASARLRYVIVVDDRWYTRAATIEGESNGKPVRVQLESDGAGHWMVDGKPAPVIEGAPDVDLGFTPATNTLPIRRLALAIGETRPVRSAWLRFPEMRLEALEQAYTREAERTYRYVAKVDGEPFTARLETDDYGRVLHYEGLWRSEPVTGEHDR